MKNILRLRAELLRQLAGWRRGAIFADGGRVVKQRDSLISAAVINNQAVGGNGDDFRLSARRIIANTEANLLIPFHHDSDGAGRVGAGEQAGNAQSERRNGRLVEVAAGRGGGGFLRKAKQRKARQRRFRGGGCGRRHIGRAQGVIRKVYRENYFPG